MATGPRQLEVSAHNRVQSVQLATVASNLVRNLFGDFMPLVDQSAVTIVVTWPMLWAAVGAIVGAITAVGLFIERHISSRFDKLETRLDMMRDYWFTGKR